MAYLLSGKCCTLPLPYSVWNKYTATYILIDAPANRQICQKGQLKFNALNLILSKCNLIVNVCNITNTFESIAVSPSNKFNILITTF